jgi:hypothetical protein
MIITEIGRNAGCMVTKRPRERTAKNLRRSIT